MKIEENRTLTSQLTKIGACILFLSPFWASWIGWIVGSYFLALHKGAKGIFFALYLVGGVITGAIVGVIIFFIFLLILWAIELEEMKELDRLEDEMDSYYYCRLP